LRLLVATAASYKYIRVLLHRSTEQARPKIGWPLIAFNPARNCRT